MLKSIRYAINVLAEAATVYARHAAVVVGVSMVLQTTYVVLSFLILNQFGLFGFAITPFVAVVVAQVNVGVMTLLVLQIRTNNEVPSMGELLKAVLPRSLALLGLAILVGIGTSIGYIMLFVPGVLFSILWSMAAPALIAGRMSVLEAMSASWGLVRPYRGTVSWVLFFQFVIALGGKVMANRMADNALESVILAQAAIAVIVAPLTGLALAEMYMRLVGYVPGREVNDLPTSQAIAPTKVWAPGIPAAAQAGAAPSKYGNGPHVPVPYGAPAAMAAQPYGAPAMQAPPYGAPGAQHAAPYGAPAGQGQPYGAAPVSPYGAPAAATGQGFGAPATHAQPPYGAQPAHAAAAYGAPAQQPYAGPPAHAQPGYAVAPGQQQYAAAPQAHAAAPQQHAPHAYAAPPQQHAPQAYAAAPQHQPQYAPGPQHATAPQAYPAGQPQYAPQHAAAPPQHYAPPQAAAPQHYAPHPQQAYRPGPGAPAPQGGPAGPQAPAREQSVAPPGFG